MKRDPRILFVCLGNICRSPAAEGVLKQMAQQNPEITLHVESCGIGDWHVGHAPDWRMQEAAKTRGIALTSRAQVFRKEFFDQFDYILVADHDVMHVLYQNAHTAEHKAKIALMTTYSSLYQNEEVPDPYLQVDTAFDLVLDMLEDACQGLLIHISKTGSH